MVTCCYHSHSVNSNYILCWSWLMVGWLLVDVLVKRPYCSAWLGPLFDRFICYATPPFYCTLSVLKPLVIDEFIDAVVFDYWHCCLFTYPPPPPPHYITTFVWWFMTYICSRWHVSPVDPAVLVTLPFVVVLAVTCWPHSVLLFMLLRPFDVSRAWTLVTCIVCCSWWQPDAIFPMLTVNVTINAHTIIQFWLWWWLLSYLLWWR